MSMNLCHEKIGETSFIMLLRDSGEPLPRTYSIIRMQIDFQWEKSSVSKHKLILFARAHWVKNLEAL